MTKSDCHGGHRVANALIRHGTEHLFTLCGGHISPILVAANEKSIRVIDVRHEVTAVFAADAVTRLSDKPGVAVVTAGPGLTNTITAVKNAQMAQSPVVLIGGATATLLKGKGALQDIDQMALLKPHVKWTGSVKRYFSEIQKDVTDLKGTIEDEISIEEKHSKRESADKKTDKKNE